MFFDNIKKNLVKGLIRNSFINNRVENLTEEEKEEALSKVENASSLTDAQKKNYYKEYVEEQFNNVKETQKEKMLSGKPYTLDAELVFDRLECKNFIDRFNGTKSNEAIKRSNMLNGFFKHVGKNVFIERTFVCEYGYNISMGDDCFMNYDCVILDCAEVTIGKHCLFGPRCQILTATHPIDYKQRRDDEINIAKPIHIGNECFFGASVIVLPGVTIGDNVVVGACSVITKDVPSNTIVAGNPAKPIKQLDPYVKE